MPGKRLNQTTFLNVDLDLCSRSNLQPLLSALEPKILILHAGRHGRMYRAHVELARSPKSADAAIRGFATLIGALPRSERRLWDAATIRDFNIGVQAGIRPHAHEVPLARETIDIVSALKARIVMTVYAPEA
jgi:hypothetical protein